MSNLYYAFFNFLKLPIKAINAHLYYKYNYLILFASGYSPKAFVPLELICRTLNQPS